ncbi:hypothetical protein AUP68_00693 [Ilyonectria robusta]
MHPNPPILILAYDWTNDLWHSPTGSDIHMENVMIREETYFQSPTVLSSDQLVIIDLGDSRTLETLSQSSNMYGNANFRAPEVKSKSGRYMSKESDMYAIGRVMAEVLEKGCDLIAKDSLVPAPLVHAAKACLRKDAKKRDTAGELVKRLDMIGSAAFKLLESGHGLVSAQGPPVSSHCRVSKTLSVSGPDRTKCISPQENTSFNYITDATQHLAFLGCCIWDTTVSVKISATTQ